MIPQVVTVGPLQASNAALLAASQTPVSGIALTLSGTQPDAARKVLLTYGNEGSARTMRIIGTNAGGNKIQETLAVPVGAPGTVATEQDFSTVTQALPAGGGYTAAVTLGSSGTAASPWQSTSHHFGPTNMSFHGVVSGTVNWGVELCYDEYEAAPGFGPPGGNVPPVVTPVPHPTLANQTGNLDGTTNDPIRAWRVVLNSGSGSVTVTGIQSGTLNVR